MTEHEPQGDEFLEKALAAGSLRAKVSPWTTREKVGRALWMILRVPLFRLSWHNWYAWRRMVLRIFGARIGRRCNIRPTARIEIPWLLEMDDNATLGDYAIVYNLGRVRIGKRTTVSQYGHLCAGSHDITKFERELLARLGMPREIVMRHRLPHFAHVFSGGGYAAGYYSYMWSEVMDADAFGAFEETGNVFDRKTARRLKEFIYSAGNRRDPVDAYVAFRGRLPTSEAITRAHASVPRRFAPMRPTR